MSTPLKFLQPPLSSANVPTGDRRQETTTTTAAPSAKQAAIRRQPVTPVCPPTFPLTTPSPLSRNLLQKKQAEAWARAFNLSQKETCARKEKEFCDQYRWDHHRGVQYGARLSPKLSFYVPFLLFILGCTHLHHPYKTHLPKYQQSDLDL